MVQQRTRLVLPDMDGVVDPLSKVETTLTRSGFAIYFEEDPALAAANSRVSFQHQTSKRRTASGNAFYGILVIVAVLALALGFFTGVIDINKMTSGDGPQIDAHWFTEAMKWAHRPEYLPVINLSLMVFTFGLSLFNLIFLIIQKCIGAISTLQTLAFSILILSIPTCMFVIGIWAATI